MNTKVVLGLAAIIIIGVGAYFFIGSNGSRLGDQNATSTPQAGGSSPSGPNSLRALVAAGQAVTCTFSTTTADGSQTSGTIYATSGMVAGDFVTNTASQAINSHMIVKDNASYVWTDLSTQGFKTTVGAGATSTTSTGGVDYDAQMNFACQPWTPTGTHFNVPTNITFTDTASMTAPGSGSGTSGNAQQCAACNQLTGSAKTQCLAALKCN